MKRRGQGSVWAGLWLAGWMTACGGSTPPAEQPDDPPPLDDGSEGPSEPAAAASSPKVQAGMDAIQAGDFAKAKTILEEAVAEAPKDAQAAFYLGVALHGGGDAKGAVTQYEKALELDPKLTEARVNLSAALLDAGDAARALEVVDEALKASPNDGALLLNRAMALSMKGDSKGALAAYEKASAAQPDNAEVQFLFAEALGAAGQEDRAAKQLEKLMSTDRVEVLASAARLFGKLKRFDACVAGLDLAIGKKPDAELFVQRGLCKHGKKDEKGALGDYQAAVAADPSFAAGHFYLGQHKRAHGDKAGAKAALAKAVELDPQGGIGKAAKKALQTL